MSYIINVTTKGTKEMNYKNMILSISLIMTGMFAADLIDDNQHYKMSNELTRLRLIDVNIDELRLENEILIALLEE